jgi:hypothetical protein
MRATVFPVERPARNIVVSSGRNFLPVSLAKSCICRKDKALGQVARSLHCFTLEAGVVMRNEYDPYSAVTFLMLGLGIGALVAIVCSPQIRERVRLETAGSRSPSATQPQREAFYRAA